MRWRARVLYTQGMHPDREHCGPPTQSYTHLLVLCRVLPRCDLDKEPLQEGSVGLGSQCEGIAHHGGEAWQQDCGALESCWQAVLGSRAMKTAFQITLSLSFGPNPSAMNGDSVSAVNLPSSVAAFSKNTMQSPQRVCLHGDSKCSAIDAEEASHRDRGPLGKKVHQNSIHSIPTLS